MRFSLVLLAITMLWCAGCGASLGNGGGAPAGGAGAGGGRGVAGAAGETAGTAGAAGTGAPNCSTSISGTVRDPSGTTPLYDVSVYVPSTTVPPIPDGVSCAFCTTRLGGVPIAGGATDARGHFTIWHAPPGTNVPVVIQTGGWRREITVPSVAACADTVLPAEQTRLPRSRDEGRLPKIAVSTGHAGALECLLRQLGIADSEFSSETGGGRVHLFHGGNSTETSGASQLASGEQLTSSYASLFADPGKLATYDIVLLSCEGAALDSDKQPFLATMKAYADAGGRIFAEHLHSTWVRNGPAPWPSTAQWTGGAGTDPPGDATGTIDRSWTKGAALADWMAALGAASGNQIPVMTAQNSVAGIVPPTTSLVSIGGPPSRPLALSFRTPVGTPPDLQCGRVDFVDLDSGNPGDVSRPETPFPNGCAGATTISAQSRLLEFLFFDNRGCELAEATAAQ